MIHIKRGDSGRAMLAFKQGGSALLSIGNTGPSMADVAKSKHKGTAPNIEENTGSSKPWAPWGVSDEFPKQIALLMRKSTIARASLQRLTKTLYGQRLFTYKVVDFDGNSDVIERVKMPEWDKIVRQSNFNAVRLALSQDYWYYGICFPEIRFNGNKELVWGLDYHKASHTRLEKMDKNGVINNVYISANFPNVNVQDCQKLPTIDFIRYPDQLDDIRNNVTNFKYVMPQFWPDALNDYYPVVYWDSAREAKWIDIQISIPIYKIFLFKNQMSLKYEIQIPIEYFQNMYKNWSSMSDDEQDKIIDALYDDIIANLTGAENAQKAIMSFYSTGKDGKPQGQWIIKTIDDKMKNDAYLPDQQAANAEIQFAFMVNPASSGQGNTGGDYSGGANNGGSNIRESGLDLRSLMQADRDITLSFFNFIKAYNGWPDEIQLGVQDMVLTTLDKGKGSEKVVS